MCGKCQEAELILNTHPSLAFLVLDPKKAFSNLAQAAEYM